MTSERIPGTTSSEDHAARDVAERRLSPRRIPGLTEPLRRVRSRTGREFDVVNVSNSGLLVEGRQRLLPNTHVDIHLTTHTGRVLVRCRVVRSYVWYLESDLVRYRVGLAFEPRVDTSAGYQLHGHISHESAPAGTRYPVTPSADPVVASAVPSA